MFLLGIMVGRGNSPITFDTQQFQKRLETIANEFGEKKDISEKMDLEFYKVLDGPVPEEPDHSTDSTGSVDSENISQEIMPKKELIVEELAEKEMHEKQTPTTADIVPSKKSRKKLTIRKTAQVKKVEKAEDNIQNITQVKYTIQIAAYKKFTDAISQRALLDEKGFTSYQVKGKKQGETWYRVRTGSFSSREEAQKSVEKLNKASINAQILEIKVIKKDEDEDIN